ncbi:hypothetical protein Avbf_10353 [Armadillidium vulgare]|nr:hypothetical protein Avbf_10353 [Armadillidium vulgare]
MSTNLTRADFERLNKIGCEHTFQLGRKMMNSVHKMSPKMLRLRGVLMLREDPSPINCRHSIHGNFRFAYQIQDSFTGECLNHRSRLHSCETPGSQFFISNQKFLLEFKKCEGMKNSYDASGEYMCLGEWREGLQHYFVATNLRESRKEERFKCFLKNREDPHYIGMSRTATCKYLLTPDNSPIRLRLEALQEMIEPSCFFPNNASGTWISSGLGEPQVEINSTHIIESRWIGYQLRKDINVCIQQKGRRFLMAKISEFGCQAEFVCWEMVPRHHNVIRYHEDAKPVQCPFSGRFTFGQKGSAPLQTRVLNGITQSPLDTYHCPNRQTDFSICDSDRKNIIIDLDYCFSLDKYGHPADIKSIPDYRLNCVGYWKENLVSYLITHDPSDSVSRFRCWVYQRVSMTELRLSQGLGSSCGLNQMYTSFTAEEGAAVALNLTFIERIHDKCPLYYNDGKNPWVNLKNELVIFRFMTSDAPSILGKSRGIMFYSFVLYYFLLHFNIL